MTPEKQEVLFHKYFSKTATEAEELQLMQWLASQAGDEDIEQLMDEAWIRFQNYTPAFSEQQSQRMLNHILQSQPKPSKLVVFRKHFLRYAAAALIIGSVIMGWFFIKEEKKQLQQAENNAKPVSGEIEPARDKAILTLANGEQIILDDAANGNISNQSGVTVLKLNGQLSYKNPSNSNSNEIVYNTITTAKGKQYRLVLEDGSSVWLNAASSLRFPVSFPADERRVQLNGEGYFEIAKESKRPFHVTINSANAVQKGSVTVLGTSFNINNYDNEGSVKTTLLEGSVGVNMQSSKPVVLKPGQQADFNGSNLKVITNANTDQAIAWKNNLFNFDNESIEDIMRQLARWYDINVKYEGVLPDKHYFGSIRRQVNLSEVLKMLEIAGGISFTLDGKNLLIKAR